MKNPMKQKNGITRQVLGTCALVLACGAATGCGDNSSRYHGPVDTPYAAIEPASAELFQPVQTNQRSRDLQAFSTAGSDTAATDVTTPADPVIPTPRVEARSPSVL